jgi:large subunit ribosomal protein L22
MAEVRAVAKYIRMSAHKVRLVTDLVRGRDVTEALQVLQFTPKSAARALAKVISSAVANAEENLGISVSELYVSEVMADEGPTLRRGRPGARGRFKPILKRSAHITVVLSDKA